MVMVAPSIESDRELEHPEDEVKLPLRLLLLLVTRRGCCCCCCCFVSLSASLSALLRLFVAAVFVLLIWDTVVVVLHVVNTSARETQEQLRKERKRI